MPRWAKVVVAPRAPVSSTGTLAKSLPIPHLGVVVLEGVRGIGPGRKIVPARPARGLGIWGDDLDARALIRSPQSSMLPWDLSSRTRKTMVEVWRGIAAASPASPPGSCRSCWRWRRDVAAEREGDDLRLQPVDHRPGLRPTRHARSGSEGGIAGLPPVLVEGRVEVPIEPCSSVDTLRKPFRPRPALGQRRAEASPATTAPRPRRRMPPARRPRRSRQRAPKSTGSCRRRVEACGVDVIVPNMSNCTWAIAATASPWRGSGMPRPGDVQRSAEMVHGNPVNFPL